MKKITSVLLCMVLVLSMFCVNAAAAESTCMEAGVTVQENGTVIVAVKAKQAAANARLTVDFDSDYLTYAGYETAFAVHSVAAGEEKLTIGLANSSANAVKPGDLMIELRFQVTGRWDKTDITVTAARFGGKAVSESVTVTAVAEGCRFQDVPVGKWYYQAVDRMAAEGYIKGISQSHFGPELPMNRASFVTLLGRMAGVAETTAQTVFTDVKVDSFYSGYVAWAVENGITKGMTENMFGPAESINRAQMVTFLYRYAQYKGMDASTGAPEEVLKDYQDGQEVCDIEWAAEPFAWAVQNGVINGMEGTLNPEGIANRAQVAVMLYRFFFEQ